MIQYECNLTSWQLPWLHKTIDKVEYGGDHYFKYTTYWFGVGPLQFRYHGKIFEKG